MQHKTQLGVTLIELMTVLLILGVLATIALPSYRQYLIRSQRTDASTSLLRIQTAQEKFFLQNNAYTDDLAAAPPVGLGLADVSDQGFYDLAVVLGAGNASFTATATPVAGGGQDDDGTCRELSVTSGGVRAAEDSSAADVTAECWR